MLVGRSSRETAAAPRWRCDNRRRARGRCARFDVERLQDLLLLVGRRRPCRRPITSASCRRRGRCACSAAGSVSTAAAAAKVASAWQASAGFKVEEARPSISGPWRLEGSSRRLDAGDQKRPAADETRAMRKRCSPWATTAWWRAIGRGHDSAPRLAMRADAVEVERARLLGISASRFASAMPIWPLHGARLPAPPGLRAGPADG